MSLKNYIEYLRNQFINSNLSSYTEEYYLPKEYKVSKSKYNVDEWDGINSFNVKLIKSSLNSEHEKEFYKEWERCSEDGIHIFRNGTNPFNDYFVQYVDEENKIRSFFPDFIMINEKTKSVFILEGKGGTNDTNIDSKTENKREALIKLLNNELHNYVFKKAIMFSYNKQEKEITYRDWKDQKLISYKDVINAIKNFK